MAESEGAMSITKSQKREIELIALDVVQDPEHSDLHQEKLNNMKLGRSPADVRAINALYAEAVKAYRKMEEK